MSENLNSQQLRAYEEIIKGENVCIVGQGGTGKSYLCELINDEHTLFICPTGMAALNLSSDARTIHSTLMLGSKSLSAWNWMKVKDSIAKNLDKLKKFFDKYTRLVFDEGSMIIAGLFDTYLNTFHMVYETSSDILFNNKQVVMILDPLQLPAIKNTCEPYINAKKKENSKPLTKTDLIIYNPAFMTLFGLTQGNIIHFTENMRCNNEAWRNVLFHCRTGFNLCESVEEKSRILDLLNSRVYARSSLVSGNELYDLNHKSLKTSFRRDFIENLNNKHMNKLKGVRYIIDRDPIPIEDFIQLNAESGYTKKELCKIHTDGLNYMDDLGSYHVIRGYENGTYTWNTEFTITVGQLVMYRKNETNLPIRNGSLGEIVKINHSGGVVSSIIIKFQGIDKPIEIVKSTFEHPDWNTLRVTAFPIITAFAITIHKLQGQTLDFPVLIHYSNIPEIIPNYTKKEHLLYTAISRCRKMEDVYIISDSKITEEYFPVNKFMFDWWREIYDDQPVSLD